MNETRPSMLRTLKAIGWSFIGIRKGSESQRDLARVHPLQLIAAGIVGAMVFVAALVALVHWVVRQPIA
ncbi:MAG: DUF2970 domain-containing protein [Betaproteobacteria bacterium]|jgi:amino acid transporter|nr:DUF2970 domain-containing protein [Betaproteobacteria bacterium]NBS47076.1 DUF2970 domain-containing protein [Betaproteobacteria bacterium]